MAAPETKDLYSVLGVSRTATKDEIKAQFKKLARKHHPDVNPGDKDAERRFKEINAAHAVLTDDAKRKLYDEFGDVALQSGFDEARARAWREAQASGARTASGRFPGAEGLGGFGEGQGFDWAEAFGGGGGQAGFEDLFSGIFSGLGRGSSGATRRPTAGEDVEAELELDFLVALRGGVQRLALDKPKTCRACQGSGTAPGPHGRGRSLCGVCGGSGLVVGVETVDVNVPRGVREGQRLRLAGLGAPGDRGGPAGDLYVRIHVREHPVWKREGDDLLATVPITVGEALNGATVRFPTPSGEVELKVPAGTPSGRRFRLRGLGVATARGPGDLYARVEVQVPTTDSGEARELARKLDRFYARDVRADLKL